MHALVFDIETAPCSRTELARLIDPFDPAEVAVGNLRDPEKIEAKIEAARAGHMDKAYDQAALAARTGTVCAIGWALWRLENAQHDPEVTVAVSAEGMRGCAPEPVRTCRDERELVRMFWEEVQRVEDRDPGEGLLVGFNSHQFDLPFLLQRSMVLRLAAPPLRRGRYWSERSVDLKEAWTCGANGPTAKGGLDAIAKFLGVGAKTGDGALFHSLLRGEDQEAVSRAVAYLANDVRMTIAVARSMHATCPLDGAVRPDNPWFRKSWSNYSRILYRSAPPPGSGAVPLDPL